MDLFESLLLNPLGLSCLLLAGSLLSSGRSASRGRRLGAAAFLVLVTASAPYPSHSVRSWIEGPRLPLPRDIRADAILVLGGGVRWSGEDSDGIDLGGAGDRVLAASRLYRAGVAPRIICSGWGGPDAFRSEAEGMAILLREWGVPEDVILVESESRSTFENCARSYELASARGVRHIALVTSALHMTRAATTCEAAGFEVTPAATDFEAEVPALTSPSSWLPGISHLDGTSRAIHEIVGTLYYRIRGFTGRLAPRSPGGRG